MSCGLGRALSVQGTIDAHFNCDGTRKNCGFTTGLPWLPMGTTSRRNVADLQKDDGSILHLYRELIRLRKEAPAFHSGD
jgi:glycosidase